MTEMDEYGKKHLHHHLREAQGLDEDQALKKELAIGKNWGELATLVCNLMNLGYDAEGDMYTTEDGYMCQPMIFLGFEEEQDES